MRVLNGILSTDKCTISEKDQKIVIMSSNSTFPEDYVEADYSEKPIKIKEIHRSNEKIILETEDADRTSLAACVLALRLFGPSKRDETVEQLRIMIKDNFYEDAHRLLNTHLSPDSYSVGTEYYDKVSLIETGDTADVKYHSEYLAKGAGLPRAYAVLYNYCKKKSFIEAWCIENAAVVEGCIFRKNCASVPEERSAIPLQTEQSSAGLLVAIIYSTIPARKFKTICLGCHSA